MLYLNNRKINKSLQMKVRRYIDHLDDESKKNKLKVENYLLNIP